MLKNGNEMLSYLELIKSFLKVWTFKPSTIHRDRLSGLRGPIHSFEFPLYGVDEMFIVQENVANGRAHTFHPLGLDIWLRR